MIWNIHYTKLGQRNRIEFVKYYFFTSNCVNSVGKKIHVTL